MLNPEKYSIISTKKSNGKYTNTAKKSPKTPLRELSAKKILPAMVEIGTVQSIRAFTSGLSRLICPNL